MKFLTVGRTSAHKQTQRSTFHLCVCFRVPLRLLGDRRAWGGVGLVALRVRRMGWWCWSSLPLIYVCDDENPDYASTALSGFQILYRKF